jgi:hypothetical protein
MEFYRIYQLFQKGLNPFKIQGRFKFEFITIYKLQSFGILKLIQKLKLLLVFQSIDLKIWQNLDIRKVANLNIKVWVFENLKIRKGSGPTCQSQAPLKRCPVHPYPFARGCSGGVPSHSDSSSRHLTHSHSTAVDALTCCR